MVDKVIAVGLVLPDLTRTVAEEHLEELTKLIETAGGAVAERVLAKRQRPDPATFVGSGKAEQVESLVRKHGATLVVFDDDLSPAQVRNLEKIIGVQVIDRSALILQIFANRARSRESRTQVELAQLEYALPRLTRQWSHLSRQTGGAGAKRGVGETQLEMDRRIVRTRIARLKDDLAKIEQNRRTQRKSRDAAFTVALVGYTNAGKSTLFNRLTRGSAEAIDKLFATLDAKSQRAAFDAPRDTVIIDTVGFIRKLPHHLVASFRSTMEEAVAADLVLHVIDFSHPQSAEQRQVGRQVLADLGVETERVIDVYNKSDRVYDQFLTPRGSVVVSALTGDGIGELTDTIRARERSGGELMRIEVPHEDSRAAARLHEVAEIYQEIVTDRTTIFRAWVPRDAVHLFAAYSADHLLEAAEAK
ncbi:MAG TPA: GTPase HflX [Thermoanaerobaculia bacterium]|nr:GTPase HflX [Thermoanaerobaculia bacterium]